MPGRACRRVLRSVIVTSVSAASVPDLESRLRPPGERAWAAVRALGRVAGPESLAVLRELARDGDWRYRRIALEALASHPMAAEAAGGVVLAALDDPSPFVVRTACETAGTIRLAAAHDAVLRFLRSPDEELRETAASALGSLWRPADFDLVFRVHRADPSPSVRKRAGWTLAENASAETWSPLFDVWSRDPPSHHRVWACRLAELHGDASSLPALALLVTDRDGHVRKAARRAADAVTTRTRPGPP